MDRRTSLVCASLTALGVLVLGCGDVSYRYADDVKPKFDGDEKTASIEAGLGCEGAFKKTETEDQKKAREERIPKGEVGKGWLKEACRIAADFDSAEPFTTWPVGDVDTWVGRRICRTQISASVKEQLGDESFAEVGKVEIRKGAGQKLWATGPSVDSARLLPHSALFVEETFKLDADRNKALESFLASAAEGKAPALDALREKDKPEDRASYKKGLALVREHMRPAELVKSDGKSSLAYPVTGNPGDPSAIHYLRQKGDRLLIVTPVPGSNPPAPCVAELWRQK